MVLEVAAWDAHLVLPASNRREGHLCPDHAVREQLPPGFGGDLAALLDPVRARVKVRVRVSVEGDGEGGPMSEP